MADLSGQMADHPPDPAPAGDCPGCHGTGWLPRYAPHPAGRCPWCQNLPKDRT